MCYYFPNITCCSSLIHFWTLNMISKQLSCLIQQHDFRAHHTKLPNFQGYSKHEMILDSLTYHLTLECCLLSFLLCYSLYNLSIYADFIALILLFTWNQTKMLISFFFHLALYIFNSSNIPFYPISCCISRKVFFSPHYRR